MTPDTQHRLLAAAQIVLYITNMWVKRYERFVAGVGLIAACGILAAIGCTRERADIDAPAPKLANDLDSLPTLPPSVLDVPLEYDLGAVLALLERVVPTQFGNIDERREIPNNSRAHYAFAAKREPFTVSVRNDTAYITGVIRYQGKGWYNPPLAPEMSGSCGIGSDWPRARIRISAALKLATDWRLRARTNVDAVEAYTEDRRDQCKVTVLSIDVTDKVLGAARGVLDQQLPKVEAKIATLDVRSKVQGWWNLLQRPIRLTDSVWLEINPTAVRFDGDLESKRRRLISAVGLTAQPRIITGPRPAEQQTQLPPLQSAEVGNGLHVLMEAALDYGVGNAILNQKLRGKKIRRGDHELEIRDIKLMGIGAGRVALALHFGGATNAHIYFVGTPRYNPADADMEVPDLDYDVGSAIMLVKGFDWLKHDDLRDFLREKAHWPVGDAMGKLHALVDKGLNRQLGKTIQLVADVDSIVPIGVQATQRALLLRARADLTARLVVGPPTSTVAKR